MNEIEFAEYSLYIPRRLKLDHATKKASAAGLSDMQEVGDARLTGLPFL